MQVRNSQLGTVSRKKARGSSLRRLRSEMTGAEQDKGKGDKAKSERARLYKRRRKDRTLKFEGCGARRLESEDPNARDPAQESCGEFVGRLAAQSEIPAVKGHGQASEEEQGDEVLGDEGRDFEGDGERAVAACEIVDDSTEQRPEETAADVGAAFHRSAKRTGRSDDSWSSFAAVGAAVCGGANFFSAEGASSLLHEQGLGCWRN